MAKRDASPEDPPVASSDADSRSAQSTENSDEVIDDDELIKNVNLLNTADFRSRYINYSLLSFSTSSGAGVQGVDIDFKRSRELYKEELNACFNLIETTSRADYEPSSFGWHSKRKRREMMENEMKYLLVKDTLSSEDASFPAAGFLSFMMTHDSSPSVPVLYIYEVHLAERLRKTGLGSHLMAIAESIAANVGVQKVMLTCFLSNKIALGFYKRHGYAKDVCSPDDRRTRSKVVKVDYVIMSKLITTSPPGKAN